MFRLRLRTAINSSATMWSVGDPALHTPLMAVTSAISSVDRRGALLAVGASLSGWATGSDVVAVVCFGQYLRRLPRPPQRMLAMYKKKEK